MLLPFLVDVLQFILLGLLPVHGLSCPSWQSRPLWLSSHWLSIWYFARRLLFDWLLDYRFFGSWRFRRRFFDLWFFGSFRWLFSRKSHILSGFSLNSWLGCRIPDTCCHCSCFWSYRFRLTYISIHFQLLLLSDQLSIAILFLILTKLFFWLIFHSFFGSLIHFNHHLPLFLTSPLKHYQHHEDHNQHQSSESKETHEIGESKSREKVSHGIDVGN